MEGLRVPCSARPNYLTANLGRNRGKESDPEALLLVWMINRPSEVKGFDQALHHLSSDDFRYGDTAIIFDISMGILDSMGAFSADANSALPNNAVYPQLLERCAQGNNTSMANTINMLVAAANQSVTSPAVITSWIDMILQRGCWDRMQEISRYLLDISSCPLNHKFTDVVAKAMVSFNEMSQRCVLDCDGSQNLVDICMRCLESVNERSNADEPQRGLLTGFDELDQMLNGLHAGKLYIVAARPSVGKTAFALNVMENIASSHSITKPILFFSLEMSDEELGFRTLSTMMRAPTTDIEYCRLPQEQMKLGYERLHALDYSSFNEDGSRNSCRVLVDDNGCLSPNLLATKVRNIVDEYGGVSLIVIDYIQLMINDSLSFGGNRNLELANISRQLKLMAKEYSCPVLALSQLNRQIETRDDQTPMLSDLRDSGAIEQDADAVMFLSKPKEHQEGEQGEIERRTLYLIKNRSGRIGNVQMNFRGAWTLFTECSADRKGAYLLSKDASKAK